MMRTVIGVLLLALAILVPSVASAQSEQVYYYYTDATGSVRMITDATGQAVEWHDYQPFGEESLINPQTPERRSYTGKERDSETNYDYSMARYYAGINGRFTTVDPGHVAGDIFNPQTWNGYTYALNNPLRYVDPDGYAGDCVYGYDQKSGQCTIGGLDRDFRFWWDRQNLSETSRASIFPEQPLLLSASSRCAAALRVARQDSSAVARAKASWPVLSAAGVASAIDAALLGAIGVRESGFRNVSEEDGAGVGVGVFQITVSKKTGVTVEQASNLPWAANYAAAMLQSNRAQLSSLFPSFTGSQLLQATAAAYNFGVRNISGNPGTIDVGTTHGNYGSNVVQLMNCF
jgi:RHS repeat-associated protein